MLCTIRVVNVKLNVNMTACLGAIINRVSDCVCLVVVFQKPENPEGGAALGPDGEVGLLGAGGGVGGGQVTMNVRQRLIISMTLV